uniref:NADH-ubiquinone oxidoreductase chain 2 n=1 Tax=Largus sp. TaxID=2931298 RepID=A0A8T9ZWU3_9HEMI|nr:NADH dehydrogenase subunit 2 [Largus sp.]
MNFSKMLFLSIIFLSALITLSAENWIGMWMGLEINLMAFIPFISMNKNKKASQASMIYFMTQSMGSAILLFSILMSINTMLSNTLMSQYFEILMTVSLLIKMGGAPFHFWLPEMMANLDWSKCLILVTWQKVAPLSIMSMININWMMYLTILMSAIVGAIGGMNQTSIRKIMAYSSINHLSWMMAWMSIKNNWYLYLAIYSLMMMMMYFILNNNIYFINQLNELNDSTLGKITLSCTLLSLGGMPPFIGFLPKWILIQSMINSNMFLIMIIMVMMSLVMLFYYMRMITPLLMWYSINYKWSMSMKIKDSVLYLIIFINMMLPLSSIYPLF